MPFKKVLTMNGNHKDIYSRIERLDEKVDQMHVTYTECVSGMKTDIGWMKKFMLIEAGCWLIIAVAAAKLVIGF